MKRLSRSLALAFLLALASASSLLAGALQDALGEPRPAWKTERAGRLHERLRQIDVRHLRLDVAIPLTEERVSGTVTMELASRLPHLERFWLDAVALEIDRVMVDGEPVPHDVLPERLLIELPEPRAQGEPFQLQIAYSARPETGLLWVRRPGPDGRPTVMIHTQGEARDHRHWFPCYDSPNDLLTSEVVVTVPGDHLALSNGRLQNAGEDGWPVTNENGSRTFHWRQSQPHANYLITLVIGEFDVQRSQVEDVPIATYAPRGRGDLLAPTFAPTGEMMRFLEDTFGVPYPWHRYDQVVVLGFESGGMENTGQTTLWEGTLIEAHERPERSPDLLLVHELAHQWFGNLVTCATWSDLWINEGFASYAEILWLAEAEGREAADWERHRSIQWYFGEDRSSHRRPIVELRYDDPDDLFDSTVYPKAAWVVGMLRDTIGDDAFREAVEVFLEEHRHQPVRTRELQAVFERVSDRDLEWFFDQWLARPGHPELAVSQRYHPASGVLNLEVEQKQSRVDGTPLFRFPVELLVETAGGEIHRETVEISQARHQFALRCPQEPVRVRFDVGHRVLKELAFEKPLEQWHRQLRADEEVLARREAAVALCRQLGEDGVESALEEALRAESFAPLRAEIATLLGAAIGGRTWGGFAGDWQGDEKTEAPAARNRWLGELLRALIASDPDPRVRTAAVRALVNGLPDDQNVGALRQALGDGRSASTQAAAARVLGRWKVRAVVPALHDALETDTPLERLERAALQALAELEVPEVYQLAVARLQPTSSREVRQTALSVLDELGVAGDPQIVAILLAHVEDTDRTFRNAVLDRLERFAHLDPDLTRHFLGEAIQDRRPRREKQYREVLEALLKKLKAAREKEAGEQQQQAGGGGEDS